MLTVFLLFLLFVGGICQFLNTSRMSTWADKLIADTVVKLRSTDSEYISVPELREEVREQVGKISVKVGILATEGVLGELTSLKRTEDVSVLALGGLTLIQLPITLTKLGVHFDVCIVRCGPAKSFDELEIKVPAYQKMTIDTRLSVRTLEGRCGTVLDYVKVGRLPNVDISFSDLCVSSGSEQINAWATNYFNDKVCSIIQTTIADTLAEQLRTHDICSFL